jgi:DNA-directed RNA polymerase specialized sigma24 family protein
VRRSEYFTKWAKRREIRNGWRFTATCRGLIELITRAADLSNFELLSSAQETLLRAWRSLDSLREESAVRGWLLTIARRELARVFERKKVPLVGLECAAELSSTDTAASDDYDVYREPLLLQMLFGYSVEETAGQLQLSVPAVLTRLYRARQLLHGRLRPDFIMRSAAGAL